jgi:hypothetical protein
LVGWQALHGAPVPAPVPNLKPDAKKAGPPSSGKKAVLKNVAMVKDALEKATAVIAVEPMTTTVEEATTMVASAAKVEVAEAAVVVEKATVVVAAVAAVGAPNATPDLKVSGKRPATTTGSGGSSPPHKRFCGAWKYAMHFLKVLLLSSRSLHNPSNSCFYTVEPQI